MDVTQQALKRLTFLPEREDSENGPLIAGQDYDDVYFTGGTIRDVALINPTITAPIFPTPLSIANGGTGVSLTSPGDDRILFWDQSTGSIDYLIPGSGLVIVDKTMVVSGVGLGDVTGPGSSTDNAIVRMNGTTGKVIQNSGAFIDDSGNITATNLSGTNTGDQTITLIGDVTGTGTGTFATTFRNSAALSVLGRSANTTGTPADISASVDFQVLRRSGTIIGFGSINLASSAAVTGVLDETNGGTGLSTFTTGDIVYASGANVLAKLPIGSASDVLTVSGGVPTWSASPAPLAANQGQQETAASTAVYTSPGTQMYHPSACKAWGNFNGTGTPAIRAGYNFASITDNGAGNYTVNFVTSMSSANYCVIANHTISLSGPQAGWQTKISNLTTSGFTVRTGGDGTTSAALVDAELVTFTVFGDM